ncbi:hypothetical protein AcW1_009122 [Taiwanofungus camphoratus]|nr:hypothetical protein AcW1_009122 [Antrodia cinnamomea]
MSKNLDSTLSSASSSTIVPPTPFPKGKSNIDADLTVSASATPAPEVSTPAVTSPSTLEPESAVSEPHQNGIGQNANARSNYTADLEAMAARVKKRSRAKGRTPEEEQIMLQTATRISSSLAADHLAVLYPDVDTPFTDATDVVKRLLPYHVFQHPKRDLDDVQSRRKPSSRKGKCKATEEDLLREEIAETKFALECWRRRYLLQDRFKRARITSGRYTSPDDQAYVLAQGILETERAETTSLNAELRSARAELDRLEREKRAAAAPPPTPRPTTTYYPPPSASSPSAYASQYRGYTYPYAHAYGGSQYTYNPALAYGATSYAPAYGSASSYVPATPTPAYNTSNTYSATTNSTTPAQAQQAQTQPAALPTISAIPVQLPATSLPALSALGLSPVPAASVSPDQPPPAAVLKSQSGTMLNLEINVASLQSAQMSGLALILNALTSRGVNVDGVAGAAGAAAGGSGAAPASSPAPS